MPLPKLPEHDLDNLNHRKRARETLNKVLDHSFDDSKVRTDAEVAAGVTPVNPAFSPGEVIRQGENVTPGTTDMSLPLQRAINSADLNEPEVLLRNQNAITRPLIITDSQPQNFSLIGKGRTAAIIQPLGIDISLAPKNVNCAIFNASNNGHLHVEKVRFHSEGGFTGVGIYCEEGGGGDATGQCLFSAFFHDFYVDFGSTNECFLKGALQNSVVDKGTFETMKGGFQLRGHDHVDVFYRNLVYFNSYDNLFQQTFDTLGSYLISVSGIHAYSHNRGNLIDVKNWNGANITDVILEPLQGNLGDCGVGKFTDCNYLTISSVISRARTGVPAGETILEFAGSGFCTAKVFGSYLTGTRAIKISTTGAGVLDFDGVDCTDAGSSNWDVSANFNGTANTTRCKFDNAQLRNVVHTVGTTMDWYSLNDTFINAGMGGNAASRNLDLTTTGTVILYNPRIGQNTSAAKADYFIEVGGSGSYTIIHPTWVGTPPVGKKTGAGTLKIVPIPGRKDITYSASMTLDAADATHFKIVPSNNVAFTINAPLNPSDGQSITIRIKNTTGGALGAVTWNAAFKMSAWTQPANGFSRTARFTYDLTDAAWVQEGGACVDIPN